ncbi:MAG: CapA family protein [Thermoflexaceae bacterium]|nr:CapA family protein [Thermoflexaceae bacterium]
MKKKLSILLSALFLLLSISGCSSPVPTDATIAHEIPDIIETTSMVETEPPTETEPPYEPVSVDLVMVGDILAHEGVYNSGFYPDGTINYDHIFAQVKDDIQAADIAIVNQEVVLGGIELGLSGYPCFNSPTELGDALITAGFNVVLHATNHTLDKGITGVDNTLNFWKEKYPDIAVLGIHDETFTDYSTQDIYVYEQNGLRIAILNYTYGTNGIPVPQSRPLIVNLLDEEKAAMDIARAKEIADFVVVCPHWGTEYVYTPDSYQKKWTQFFYEHEVDLVIGTHPHVIEPVEWIESEDSDHKMLVYYSLGNFVSNQDRLPRMLGAMAKVTISMDLAENVDLTDESIIGYHKKIITDDDNIPGTSGGDELIVYISEYGVEPLVTHKLFGPGSITTYKLSDYTDTLAAQNRINNDEPGFSLQYLKDLSRQVFGDLYVE